VNLFQRKSAILIVLSWTMLVAVAACWFAGWWWWLPLPFCVFCFLQMALPAPVSPKRPRHWEQVGFQSVAFLSGIHAINRLQLIHLDLDGLWNHRMDWQLIVMGSALLLFRMTQDWRYFSNVPAKDLAHFLYALKSIGARK
jgi:hypothetical protein